MAILNRPMPTTDYLDNIKECLADRAYLAFEDHKYTAFELAISTRPHPREPHRIGHTAALTAETIDEKTGKSSGERKRILWVEDYPTEADALENLSLALEVKEAGGIPRNRVRRRRGVIIHAPKKQ